MGRTVRTTVNDKSTTYLYDDLGRVYQEEGYNSFKGYKYAGISQYPIYECSGIFHKIIYYEKNYEYDDEMRVSSVQENENDIVSYTYDANGNKKSETLGNGVISTYTYNKANRITKIENKKGNSNISVYEYSYYLDGSDACKVRNENGIIETTEYEYDGLKRLTEESVKVGNSTGTYAYEYDDYGNRSRMTATGSENYVTEYSYNNAQGKYTALLQKETKTVEDDNALKLQNNVKQTVYTYDANGNQITKTADGKTETNTYDGLNQLIGFTDGETTASYTYGISGLRDSKTVNGVTTTHIWSGSQIVVDYTAHYTSTVYIRGTSLAAAFDWDEGRKGDNRFYIQNAHGDVVNLTNADGEVTKKYTYDAFGVEKDIDDSDTNAFRYCGEYYDKETATVYLRARYYNPSTGRFISRDTVAGKLEDPLSLNLYNYCANNPILYFDPSEHIKMPKWAKNTWDFIKGTAKEVPYYALDVTMGLSNAIDENLAFGVGNKIRENFGVDAYEPYDQSYYSGVYNVGEAGSAVANAYMLATGVGGLSGSLKNITQAFKGGSKIIAGADGVAVLTSSVSLGNVAEGIIGVVRSGALSGWASGNIVYSKWSGRAKNKLKPDPNATGPHTTYKVDPNTGEITNYVEWEPNPQNPSGFDEAKRYDGTGGSHYNKATGTDVDTPHVHDPKAPGGVRSPYDWEIPK